MVAAYSAPRSPPGNRFSPLDSGHWLPGRQVVGPPLGDHFVGPRPSSKARTTDDERGRNTCRVGPTDQAGPRQRRWASVQWPPPLYIRLCLSKKERSCWRFRPIVSRLAGARKIAHRLMSRVGRPNSGQLARLMHTRQRNRIPPVRLDPLARSFLGISAGATTMQSCPSACTWR